MIRLALVALLASCAAPDAPTQPKQIPATVIAPAPVPPPEPAPVLTGTERKPRSKVHMFAGDVHDYLEKLQGFDQMIIFEHYGGTIRVQTEANDIHKATGKTAHLPGFCISACTMLFDIKTLFTFSCGSVFRFHAASVPGAVDGQRVIHHKATQEVIATYPVLLRAELHRTNAMGKLKHTPLTGQQIADATGLPCYSPN